MSVLYVDDLRPCPWTNLHKIDNPFLYNNDIIVCRNYKETIEILDCMEFDVIDLDHDLGEEKTGYDICKYIVENKIECPKFYLHTANPVGRLNMKQLLQRYLNCQIICY